MVISEKLLCAGYLLLCAAVSLCFIAFLLAIICLFFGAPLWVGVILVILLLIFG